MTHRSARQIDHQKMVMAGNLIATNNLETTPGVIVRYKPLSAVTNVIFSKRKPQYVATVQFTF